MRTPTDKPSSNDTEQSQSDHQVPDDDFIRQLDENLRKRNERLFEKLTAWGVLLDRAGWCVTLKPVRGDLWISENARQDLEALDASPSTWSDLAAILDRVSPLKDRLNGEGVMIWPASVRLENTPGPAKMLTRRENEVMSWLREGKTSAEIAIILGCAIRTVEKHLANLYRKVGARNRETVILNRCNI